MQTTSIEQLLTLAAEAGTHPQRLAIWGEGSCALKTSEERMLVSKEGATLATLGKEDLVELDFAKLSALSASDQCSQEQLADALANPQNLTPSSDAFLYAYFMSLGATMALHTQPVEINQILCSPRARQFADRRSLPTEVTSCGQASLLVPYADPGLALAREVRRKMVLWRDRYKTLPRVVLLHNHGLVILADNANQILEATEMTIKAAQVFVGASMLGGPAFLTPNNVSFLSPPH